MTSEARKSKTLWTYLVVMAALATLVATVYVSAARRRAVPPTTNAIVAHVNNAPISQSVVEAREQSVISALRGSPINSKDLFQVALRFEVDDEILFESAPRYGVVVSASEASDLARQSRDAILASGDDAAKTIFASTLTRLGITSEQYSTDSRVVATFQRMLAVNRMRAYILDGMSAESRVNDQLVQAAIDDFVAQQHAVVTYP